MGTHFLNAVVLLAIITTGQNIRGTPRNLPGFDVFRESFF
jgi:hypothetical protein